MSTQFAPVEDTPTAVVDAFEALLEADDCDSPALSAYAGSLVARLRHLNREGNMSTQAHRQFTADARSAMDQTHLGLQNLLYERRHLEREIQKCRQFEFIYQDIRLHPLEEFAQLVPGSAMEEDEHQLMKTRLEFEFVERGRLEEKKKQLTLERDRLLREKKDHRIRLETESREESEFAKKAAALDSILSELTLMTSSPALMPTIELSS